MSDLEINDQEITLDIRYDMHEEDWKDLVSAFKKLPGWIGVEKTGAFFWLGKEKDEVYIKATITFTGLLVEACLPDIVWEKWKLEFIKVCSEALGCEVKSVYNESED